MLIDTIIIDGLNSIFLLLTPVQRWQALKEFETNLTVEHWLILIGAVALLILVALFLWISYKRMIEERKIAESSYSGFFDCAERAGLSEEERQTLLRIALKSGLKQSDAIFSMEDAFNRGATKLVEENVTAQMSSTKSTLQRCKENEHLKTILAFLREKLGFLFRSSTNLTTKSKKLNSRQIPIGKELQITPCETHKSAGIDCTVIKNDDIELTLKLNEPVKIGAGEYWRARFNFKASVCEFDSSVVRCDGDIIVLNHSNNIRFINLRRFVRVPVKKPAFIARFPFVKVPHSRSKNDNGKAAYNVEPRSEKNTIDTWGPPEFIPAVVTELAGVGLRLNAPLDVKSGDRLIIVFKLYEEEDNSSFSKKAGKIITSKIIQDICEVKRIRPIENGLSIAVELIGLSDSDVNELVRATNIASARINQRLTKIPVSKRTKNKPVIAQSSANPNNHRRTRKKKTPSRQTSKRTSTRSARSRGRALVKGT
jgi:hypothetical protein